MARILIIDDDAVFRATIRKVSQRIIKSWRLGTAMRDSRICGKAMLTW